MRHYYIATVSKFQWFIDGSLLCESMTNTDLLRSAPMRRTIKNIYGFYLISDQVSIP